MSLVEKLLQHQLSSLTITANFTATWLGDGILQLLPRCGWQHATVLSAGIHGNETAPIEQLLRLMQNVVSQSDYQGHALLFIFGNIPAMQKAKRYLDYFGELALDLSISADILYVYIPKNLCIDRGI